MKRENFKLHVSKPFVNKWLTIIKAQLFNEYITYLLYSSLYSSHRASISCVRARVNISIDLELKLSFSYQLCNSRKL